MLCVLRYMLHVVCCCLRLAVVDDGVRVQFCPLLVLFLFFRCCLLVVVYCRCLASAAWCVLSLVVVCWLVIVVCSVLLVLRCCFAVVCRCRYSLVGTLCCAAVFWQLFFLYVCRCSVLFECCVSLRVVWCSLRVAFGCCLL